MAKPLILLAAVAFLALSGCSSGEKGVIPEQDAEGRYVIQLTLDNTFDPEVARVPLGATVAWVMGGNTTHDVDAYAPGSDFSTYSSNNPPPGGLGRLMVAGDVFAKSLTEKGIWRTYCHTHHYEEMRGQVIVG